MEQLNAAKYMRVGGAVGAHRATVLAEAEITTAGMTDRTRVRAQQQQRIHSRFVPSRRETPQRC